MLKIGWAKRSIATEKAVVIPGQFHMRVSEGVLDPIYVTALVLDSGDDHVVFLQSDTISIAEGVLKQVREKLEGTGIDPMKVILNATHTHAGPLVKNDNVTGWGALSEVPHEGYDITPPEEYWDFYINQICDTIREAFDTRKEGWVSYGYGFATVAHSRRVVYSKDDSEDLAKPEIIPTIGHTKMYGDTSLDTFSHYEAGTESFANFLYTFDKGGKLTGAIVNVPCPSQNSEHEWLLSADYWGDVRQELAKRYGDIYILPQCAAAGDLAPRQLHYKKAELRRYRLKFADVKLDPRAEYPEELHRRRDIAMRICDAFDEVYSWASKEKYDDLPLIHSVKSVRLERRVATDEEYALAKAEKAGEKLEFVHTGDRRADLKHNSIAITGKRFKTIIDRYEAAQEDPEITEELHMIRLGNIAFATNPYELYMDYQHRIQARSPFEQTFIVQLCSQPHRGTGTYLPTERGVWGVGYSATKMCNLVSPAGGQKLVDETVAELKKLWEEEK